MFQTVPDSFQPVIVESVATGELPDEMCLFGVVLAQAEGVFFPSYRWMLWIDAAKFGEDEVTNKKATGFWVFKEPRPTPQFCNETF